MSELQRAQEKIKFLEERADVLQQLADSRNQARILIKQKMEHLEQEMQKYKAVTRFIWN